MELLSRELVGGFTVLQVLMAVGAVGVVLLILNVTIGRSGQKESHLRQATCSSCGWRGNVSQHTRKCPKCNAAL